MSLLLGGGGLMRGINILQQEFALKIHGGLMREGGAYLRDNTVSGRKFQSHKNVQDYTCYLRIF